MVPTSTSTSSGSRRALVSLLFLGALVLLGAEAVLSQEGSSPADAKQIGTDACLICHSDRPEMVSFPHRARVEDLGGCESCHGPGSAHAESRGAPGTIRNPQNLPAGDADRSCALCHADISAPEHFLPTPGRERCVDCHTIHEPAPLPSAMDEALPGRPPLVLEVDEGATAGTAPNPFLLPQLPPLPEVGGTSWFGVGLTGSVKAGLRFVSEQGNDRVADQDLNYDSGVRLFDFDLNMTRGDTRILITASGLHDPVEHYTLEIDPGAAPWHFSTDWMATDFAFRATGDPRDYTSSRDILRNELNVQPSERTRLTFGWDLMTREGNLRGARLLKNGYAPSNEPFNDESNHLYARAGVTGEKFTGSVQFGYRFDNLESRLLSMQGAGTTFNQEQSTDADAPILTLLATFRPVHDLTIDGRLVWSDLTADTHTRSMYSDPNTVETTRDRVNADREYLRAEIGATFDITPELYVMARLAGVRDFADETGHFSLFDSEPPMTAPVVTTWMVNSEEEQRRSRVLLEAGYRPCDFGAVRVGFEYVNDSIRLTTDGDRMTQDSDMRGLLLGVDLDPTKDLSVDLLYRFVNVDDPFAEIGMEDEDQSRVRARWQATDDLSLSGFLAERRSTNDRRDTDILSVVTGITASLEVTEDLTVEATADYQLFDTETNGVIYVGGLPQFGKAKYDGHTTGFTAFAAWQVLPEFALTASAAWYHTRGDYGHDWYRGTLGAAWDLVKTLTVGTDLKYTKYSDHEVSADGYRSWIWELWFRFRF